MNNVAHNNYLRTEFTDGGYCKRLKFIYRCEDCGKEFGSLQIKDNLHKCICRECEKKRIKERDKATREKHNKEVEEKAKKLLKNIIKEWQGEIAEIIRTSPSKEDVISDRLALAETIKGYFAVKGYFEEKKGEKK